MGKIPSSTGGPETRLSFQFLMRSNSTWEVDHALSEKSLLAQCRHPFVLSFVASFQDPTDICLVFDLCLGGELFTLLRDKGTQSPYLCGQDVLQARGPGLGWGIRGTHRVDWRLERA